MSKEQEAVGRAREERKRISLLVSNLAPRVVARLDFPMVEDVQQAVLEVVAETGMGDTPQIRSYLAIATVQAMRRLVDSGEMADMAKGLDRVSTE